jgi:hypothetical protein
LNRLWHFIVCISLENNDCSSFSDDADPEVGDDKLFDEEELMEILAT